MTEVDGAPRERFQPLLFFYFLLFTNSFYSAFGSFQNGKLAVKSGESALYQLIYIAAYALLAFKLIEHWRLVLNKFISSIELIMLLQIGVLAYVVVNPEIVSIQRYGMYIGTILLALYISIKYDSTDVFFTFFVASGFILVIHFASYPFLSSKIVYDDSVDRMTIVGTTSYAGFFGHKNGAAAVFAFFATVSFPRCFRNKGQWAARLICTGSLVATLLTGGVGPLIGLILASIGISELWIWNSRPKSAALLSALALAYAALALYLTGIDQLLGLFGRSADLTGRDAIFELWPRFFMEHPFFGWGFNGFFNGQPGAPALRLSPYLLSYQQFGTFESGYLEILSQFGALGGLAYFFIALKTLSNALYFSRQAFECRYVPMMILLNILFLTISQSSIMIQNSPEPLLFFWIYFGCGMRPPIPRAVQAPAIGNYSRSQFQSRG
ncbi:MAG TPA: O-antigen ligase family protein [Methylocella sp.]|nr:O-antigen ligase family protein [Methylocella sp.]